MKKLKAGIIGLGVGEAHIAGYQSHPFCEVAAICDFSSEKLSYARQKYPSINIVESASTIIHDPSIDIISVASYDNFHCEQVVGALNQGKHVFVEKPLCLFESEAVSIRNALNRNPLLKLSSNLILRRYPRFQKVKQLIEKGTLGQLFYLEGDYNYGRLQKITSGWRGEIDYYSVTYGGGIHLVDLLLWLTGDEALEVSAFGNQICSKATAFHNNDFTAALIRFRSGMVAKVTSNYGCVFPHFHGLSVYGTDGSYVHERHGGRLYQSRDPNEEPTILTDAYPGVDKSALLFNFVESIVSGRTADVAADDVFRAMSVCFAIERAIESKSVVPIKYF